jgi:response regulator receiver domain-containing protein
MRATLTAIFATASPLRSRGLGLGLSISEALVVRQGGDIIASSKGEGFGSEFLVTLPVIAPVPDAGTSEPAPATAKVTKDRRLKILLAEDHTDTAQVLARLLSRFGHEVDIVGTSADAIELYRRKKYDLFLSDLGLPDCNGIELLQKFKEIRDGGRYSTVSGTRLFQPLD